jgi:hypothetical protein
MMRDRLELLRRLLSDDGSIWITIDDTEVHYLKVLCDEVFGRANFVSNVIWQKKYTVANDAKWLSESHDHVLVYAANKAVWRPWRMMRTSQMNEGIGIRTITRKGHGKPRHFTRNVLEASVKGILHTNSRTVSYGHRRGVPLRDFPPKHSDEWTRTTRSISAQMVRAPPRGRRS